MGDERAGSWRAEAAIDDGETSTSDRTALISWIEDSAHPIATVDPWAPLDDLAPLVPMVGHAVVVALGESVRGVRSGHEFYGLKHRILRLAVEQLGFRSMALEERDESGAAAIDEYVCTGGGDPQALLAGLWAPWQTEEFLDVVRWMRAYNADHPDDLARIVGVVSDAPHGLAYNTLAWHERTGDRILYWGGIAHTAVGRANSNSFPPNTSSPATGPTDGSILRDRLGSGYLSVGLTCHHGAGGAPLPAPAADFAESILGSAGPERYFLDLHGPQPDVARRWLTAPATTRVIGPHYDPDNDAAYHMTGSSLAGWFDVIIHLREITPARHRPSPSLP